MRMIFKDDANCTPIIEANADGFIIPNKAWSWGKLVFGMESLRKACETFEGWTEKTKMVQMWLVSEDLESDNLRDHGGCYSTDQVTYNVRPAIDSVPYDLLKGHKEGDVIDIDIPARHVGRITDDGEWIEEDCILRLHIRLAQKEYRYKNFGSFEECLKHVA